MNNTIIRRVMLLGTLSILSLTTIQSYWVLRTWDLQEKEFNRKVNQALLDAANGISILNEFTLQKQKLIQQVSSNYWVVNVDNEFEDDDLEFYLNKSFEIQGLKEDYQYGIFDCSSDQMVKGRLIKYTNKVAIEGNIPLPKHTTSEFNHYFGVQFPNKQSNILSNMWWVVAFSILMVITIAFFVYSMFVILRQKQLSEQQRDFINNMTHEFKTPISTINISTDVFLQNEHIQQNDRLSQYARIIKDQTQRLNAQVEKVLQLARIERNSITLKMEPTNLTDFIKNLQPSLEIKVNEKMGTLTLLITNQAAPTLTDQMHLTNVIHNLVDNAVKYSNNKPDITIRLIHEDNVFKLSIQDKGIGINKEHQKHVFDKFYRVPTGNLHDVKGFGLGLYYVKSICDAHKWKINLHSTPGKGTTVEIMLKKIL
jgi:two-component system phosphate regulon sensor histidine kinase PhoR